MGGPSTILPESANGTHCSAAYMMPVSIGSASIESRLAKCRSAIRYSFAMSAVTVAP